MVPVRGSRLPPPHRSGETSLEADCSGPVKLLVWGCSAWSLQWSMLPVGETVSTSILQEEDGHLCNIAPHPSKWASANYGAWAFINKVLLAQGQVHAFTHCPRLFS